MTQKNEDAVLIPTYLAEKEKPGRDKVRKYHGLRRLKYACQVTINFEIQEFCKQYACEKPHFVCCDIIQYYF